ncbi:MAG: hypothetical protein EBX40_07715 [Gammaproteobacteria bacterium]|nr:hypothetical protein [Gammaproteobacteria bacterium]
MPTAMKEIKTYKVPFDMVVRSSIEVEATSKEEAFQSAYIKAIEDAADDFCIIIDEKNIEEITPE